MVTTRAVKMVLCLLGLLLVTACATRQTADQRSGEIYLRHAGGEVQQVRFSSIIGWQPVGNDSLLLSLGARGDYLLQISPECHFDLRSSPRIGLDSQLRGVLTRFDRVLVGCNRCRIHSIRPVDMDAVNEELRLAREASADGGLRPVDTDNDQDSSGGT